MKKLCLFWLVLTTGATAPAQDNLSDQTPPHARAALIDAPATPRVSVSSDGKWMRLMDAQDLPTIADLAQPELRIAGLRLNPRTNGPSRTSYSIGMKLKRLDNGQEFAVQSLPDQPRISQVTWSPDNARIAFAHTQDDGTSGRIELWTVDVATAAARRLTEAPLNGVFGSSYEWFPDNQTLVVRTVPAGRGQAPAANPVPTGPVVQENVGKTAAARTYQDLMKNPNDERVFDHYATSQLLKVSLDGQTRAIGQPGVIQQASPSPDGRYLLVETRHRPYSYQLTVGSFPNKVDVLDRDGNPVKTLADLPLADNVPTSFDAVPVGPRAYEWRGDAAATLCWVEAQDGGDPRKEAPIRDKVFTLEAPFTAAPQELVALPLRYEGITWANASLALVDGYRWADRKRTTWTLNPAAKSEPRVLFDRSSEDTYHDPGTPYLKRNAEGKYVLATDADGQFIYLIGDGASPEGDRPFVDAFDLKTRKSVRWWRSEAPYYEVPVALLDADQRRVLTRRESQADNPNYFIRDLKKKKLTQFTQFPNPYAGIGSLKKRVLQYQRADGVALTANLYLPPNYKKEDGPLPTLMEAYPVEFKDKQNASQITGSPHEFTRLSWGSPVFWVTQGYAVLENASIPIVGEGQAEPNDTYTEQLVASAKAAVDEGVRLGVVDAKRVGVMGHSYGAFMTANLLAHSDLFKAGIARSGAYNRTLTPFGFQREERTYWEAPEVYHQMSPFSHANKIKTPILLIHGEADNNSGTFPLQTERFYNALKGHGATVRYVVLPFESHGYAARESVMHMLWEMDGWLNKYVKNPGAPATTSGGKAQSK